MNETILKEYYLLHGSPVVLLMTQERVIVQAWTADRDTNKMKRAYALIQDIREGHYESQIEERDFQRFCAKHNIKTDLPVSSVNRSFSQAQQGEGLGVMAQPSRKPLQFDGNTALAPAFN